MSTQRVSIKDLEAIVRRINRETGSPEASWQRSADNKLTALVGNYHLDEAYGKVALVRMVNEDGGITVVCGRSTKRELQYEMFAFLAGVQAAREAVAV